MFLDILNRYLKGFYMPKNTFFEGTKNISVQKYDNVCYSAFISTLPSS